MSTVIHDDSDGVRPISKRNDINKRNGCVVKTDPVTQCLSKELLPRDVLTESDVVGFSTSRGTGR